MSHQLRIKESPSYAKARGQVSLLSPLQSTKHVIVPSSKSKSGFNPSPLPFSLGGKLPWRPYEYDTPRKGCDDDDDDDDDTVDDDDDTVSVGTPKAITKPITNTGEVTNIDAFSLIALENSETSVTLPGNNGVLETFSFDAYKQASADEKPHLLLSITEHTRICENEANNVVDQEVEGEQAEFEQNKKELERVKSELTKLRFHCQRLEGTQARLEDRNNVLEEKSTMRNIFKAEIKERAALSKYFLSTLDEKKIFGGNTSLSSIRDHLFRVLPFFGFKLSTDNSHRNTLTEENIQEMKIRELLLILTYLLNNGIKSNVIFQGCPRNLFAKRMRGKHESKERIRKILFFDEVNQGVMDSDSSAAVKELLKGMTEGQREEVLNILRTEQSSEE